MYFRRFLGLVIILLSLYLGHGYIFKNEIRLSPWHILQVRKHPPIKVEDVQIYVINLEQSKERYALISASLANSGLKWHRFNAVDGYLLKITDEQGITFTGQDLKNEKHKFTRGKNYTIHCPSGDVNYHPTDFHSLLTAGELGCFCSHRGVWQDAIKKNYQHVLILEDDVVLSQYFNTQYKYFATLLKNIPLEYSLLYILYDHVGGKGIDILNNKFLSKPSSSKKYITFFASAYMLSKQGMQYYYNASKNFGEPVDILLGLAKNKGEDIYMVRNQKYAVMHNIATSSAITRMGRER